MYLKLAKAFEQHKIILWANLNRVNNLMIILNISIFFLTGLVARGYFFTFFSIGCFGIVAVLTIMPVSFIGRLWYYLFNLLIELVGLYFLLASIIYWVNTGAQVSR